MGRYNIRGGYIVPQNIQSASGTITTDENGDGTNEITFVTKFKNTPKVIPVVVGNDITGSLRIVSKSELAVVLGIDGSSLTGQAVTVDYIAMDNTLGRR